MMSLTWVPSVSLCLMLAKFEAEVYLLFLGENKIAWKIANERQLSTQLASPQAWHGYAKVLYDISEHLPSLIHMAYASMNSPLLLHKK